MINKKLVLSILLPLLAGAIGSLATFKAIPSWYALLEKPFFTPPNWVFGPVWTTLYILMGIALYRVWTRSDISHIEKKTASKPVDKRMKKAYREGLRWFWAQLILNTLWSLVFFGLHWPLGGMVVIAALLFAVVETSSYFRRVDKTAANLLIPYIIWISFAAFLNVAIVLLN